MKARRSVQRQRLARRTFLRGAAGGVAVSVGLPVLDIMLNENGTALADGIRPRRGPQSGQTSFG